MLGRAYYYIGHGIDMYLAILILPSVPEVQDGPANPDDPELPYPQ
jgi:hypothetical protein